MDGFNNYFIVGTDDFALKDTMNGVVVGELVRCKDCKHCGWMMEFETLYTTYKCAKHKCDTDLNRYCSWAERRTK